MKKVEDKISKWLHEYLDESEFFLVDVVQSGKKVMVYMDSDQSLHIDKCVEVSRFLEERLEDEKLVSEDYLLEVSSPGMSNPLKVKRQYHKSIGRELDVLLKDGTRKEGVLKSFDEDQMTLEQQIRIKKSNKIKETRTWILAFADVKTAKRKITF